MSYRKARVSTVVRDVVSDAIANRLWDPRVSRFTSVTRVEVSSDLRIANAYVSVMGTDSEAATTLKGLQSARGMIQTRLARRLNTRHCPILRFHLDKGLKSAIEAIRQIEALKAEHPSTSAGQERASLQDGRESEEGPSRPPDGSQREGSNSSSSSGESR